MQKRKIKIVIEVKTKCFYDNENNLVIELPEIPINKKINLVLKS